MRHATTLTDAELTLRPLTEADIPGLCVLAADCADDLALMGTSPAAAPYYQTALDASDQQPFAIVVDGELAGSTRYGDIRTAHAGLEIGWTWLHPRHMGTGINRRMKLLLLAHAFEALDMQRVQLKTDNLNTRSQRAIEKIGAVREGVLRKHQRRQDGTLRDTVMFSITADEWPSIRAGLGSS
ncbi:GNAT family N-acetyltransferase [Deinococcus arenicola]|uniref:GNAT family protein n=1 Tax=Deinococcus arenicola TaxID=2994950 RepID=A0ABU4DM71_9DEIO|nr:GNAT family protein [Deinococcus sp. ZS9-10]MDV6373042.1 GNAT family protein [Deinococcus sp. ZS9-10]